MTMLPALHSLTFRVHTRTAVTLLVVLIITAALWAAPEHRVLIREATVAASEGKPDLALQKLEAARALRPDYPRVLLALAQGYAAAGREAEAIAALHEIAALGLAPNLHSDRALAALLERPEAAAVRATLLANAASQGDASVALSLPDCDGIIEGLAVDTRGNWYFSDVRNRCLWRRTVDGKVARFTEPNDALYGILGITLDESHGTIWAATAALPEMKGSSPETAGRAGLAEFDLLTGHCRRTIDVQSDGRTHVLGDLRLMPDGGILLTDSAAPVIWRLAPGGRQLERWCESDDFVSLQGLAPTSDATGLIVADYASGLWLISADGHSHSHIAPPDHSTFFGIDGLYDTKDGLIAVQNGVSPQRVIRIGLDSAAHPMSVSVLAVAGPHMSDISLGTVAFGRFHFIGDAGWEAPASSPARPVHVLSLQLQAQ